MSQISPTYTIIIPLKEINDYVRETVSYVQALDSIDWELIIVPNNDDINEWENEKRISLISSGRVGPADKRDQAAKIAKGKILVFLDDDSYPKSDLLSIATRYFSDESISAIGGPAITPDSDTYWQKVSGAVFLSRFTGGNPERYKPIGGVKRVDDWPSVNFMVRKSDFLEIGGFDSPYWPGEDTHLCLKLVKAARNIYYVPTLIVWHHRRSGLLRHMRQVGAYGLHRGYFARHMPETSRKLKYFLPSIVTIELFAMISLPVVPMAIDRVIQLGLFFYILILCGGFVDIMRKTNLVTALFSIPFVVSTHLSYGFNFIKGFLRRKELVSRLR